MTINAEIRNFSDFLNSSFEYILKAAKRIETEKNNADLAYNIKIGFLQFAWEMMVEAVLFADQGTIDPYGEGADFYGLSERVTYPDRPAMYWINVDTKGATNLLDNHVSADAHLDFLELVNFVDGGYSRKTPFNWVLCEDDTGVKAVYQLQDVDFILEKLPSE